MLKIKVVKLIVRGFVGVGVGRIVKGIIENNVDTEKVIDRLAVGAGSFALGGIAVDASKDYMDAKIDALYEAWTTRNDKPVVETQLDDKPQD